MPRYIRTRIFGAGYPQPFSPFAPLYTVIGQLEREAFIEAAEVQKLLAERLERLDGIDQWRQWRANRARH